MQGMGRVLFLSLFFLFDLILSLDVFLMDSTCPEFFTCHVRVSVRKSVFCCHVQSVVCTENQLPSWVSSKGAFTLSSLVVSFFFCCCYNCCLRFLFFVCCWCCCCSSSSSLHCCHHHLLFFDLIFGFIKPLWLTGLLKTTDLYLSSPPPPPPPGPSSTSSFFYPCLCILYVTVARVSASCMTWKPTALGGKYPVLTNDSVTRPLTVMLVIIKLVVGGSGSLLMMIMMMSW